MPFDLCCLLRPAVRGQWQLRLLRRDPQQASTGHASEQETLTCVQCNESNGLRKAMPMTDVMDTSAAETAGDCAKASGQEVCDCDVKTCPLHWEQWGAQGVPSKH